MTTKTKRLETFPLRMLVFTGLLHLGFHSLSRLECLGTGPLEPWDFERLADTNAAGEATRCLDDDDDDDDEAALTGTAGRRPRLHRDDA